MCERKLKSRPFRTPLGMNNWNITRMQEICDDINDEGEFQEHYDTNKREALRCIEVASECFRDTLRDLDEIDSDSDAGDESNSRNSDPPGKNLVLFFVDGTPDPQHIPSTWRISRHVCGSDKPMYEHIASNYRSSTHPMLRIDGRYGSTRLKGKSKVIGVAGRVPVLDLLRIWDTGASQGMVDKAVVSSKHSFEGS